ncbi:autoinducer binding domain-containing protein [Cognatiyoonia sp. IB215182]|uniref:autoinducer binding domain-containing protein n=1 Tax=Cognatiyoonia sp. IB215182 TaxID=3097353 RepID=UPI002A24EE69|nr:autoinducer binding domain-containing protein [Cognatiyoonia sp. IB215182]
MSSTQIEISAVLGELNELAPAGYAIGLQIEYATPKFMFQTYSKAWLDLYAEKGLLMSDPTLAWGFDNTGAIRWDKLRDNDPVGVLELANEHGIKFGITCAHETPGVTDGIRSVGSFARGDRDFTDEEVASISRRFNELHDSTQSQAHLSDETVAQLRKMSILVTHPGS